MDTPTHKTRVAWEPVTWRGVAAFASAPFSRLLLVQSLCALVAAGAIAWFLETAWFPILDQAVSRLPPGAAIQSGLLHWPAESPTSLAEGHFLALVVDLNGQNALRSTAHLQIDLQETRITARSLLGNLDLKYDPVWTLPLDQARIQPWWGAWRPAILVIAAAATFAGLILTWAAFATVYSLPVWLVAFLAHRTLSLPGSWRLASAALMPGALLETAALFAYGLGALDLVRLAAATAAHFAIGWLYLIASTLSLPSQPSVPPQPTNPFAPPH